MCTFVLNDCFHAQFKETASICIFVFLFFPSCMGYKNGYLISLIPFHPFLLKAVLIQNPWAHCSGLSCYTIWHIWFSICHRSHWKHYLLIQFFNYSILIIFLCAQWEEVATAWKRMVFLQLNFQDDYRLLIIQDH